METPIMLKDDLFLITGATGNTGVPTVEVLCAGRLPGPGKRRSGPATATSTDFHLGSGGLRNFRPGKPAVIDGMGAQLRCPSEIWGAAMSEQLYDFFGEIFQRYFRPAIDVYPQRGGALVERLLRLTDQVPDRLAQTRCAARAWAKAETPNATIASELFVITQHGLVYAAGLNESRRALYYLATPPALFDPFVDQVDTAELHEGAVVAVDSRFGRDLTSAHPMDAALRRILDEHLALRVDLPA
jgi:hypothetical protein